MSSLIKTTLFIAWFTWMQVPTQQRQLRVTDADFNIVLLHSDGSREVLTTTGRDRSPWITCDGNTVLFVRNAPEDSFRTSVYMIDTRSKAESVLFDGPLEYQGQSITGFSGPKVDGVRQTLFVIANTSVTSGELFAIDLRSKVARRIADAASFDVIQNGDHAGSLLVYQRKLSPLGNGAIYYVYWLYSAGGQDMGIAGPDKTDFSGRTSCNP